MITFFKKIVAFKLKLAAKLLLWRQKPETIAITGSAGKTSAKEFLAKLLSVDYNVLVPSEGYNTEIGAPLSLFGEKVPVPLFSPLKWTRILAKVWMKALFMSDLPEKIIIEMGADSPGDIKYLCELFKPKKGVILSVLPVHLEEFKTIDAIANEKGELAKTLTEEQKLFLNYDDPRVRKMAEVSRAEIIYFGKEGKGNYVVSDLRSDLSGINFTLDIGGLKERLSAKLYGDHMIYPLVSAIAVAKEEGITVEKIKEAVAEITPFKGRMNVIPGINGAVIIDDSYNANPQSMLRSLEFLEKQKGRKIAVLGSMGELGSYEARGHEIVGEKAAKAADLLITVGEAANKYIAGSAKKEGLSEKKIKTFKKSNEAGKYLQKEMQKGDIALLKGSQNAARMEKAVFEIMLNKDEAKDVLVRQSTFWNKEV